MLKLAIDIETACNVGCIGRCEHALDAHRNRITVVGAYFLHGGDGTSRTFRSLPDLRAFLFSVGDFTLVGHNLKFDLRTLAAHGLDLRTHWGGDTQLMAATLTEKISPAWLENYESMRAQLPKGQHRAGSLHSLKTLAPYFLGVAPFWEAATHDNDEYVLADCRYTYELAEKLEEKLRAEGGWDFYEEKLLPWARMLLDMELRGVALDRVALEVADFAALQAARAARGELDRLWAPAYECHRAIQATALAERYDNMQTKAMQKAKHPIKVLARYEALYQAAVAKLPRTINLDSPAQLAWLLRDYFQLDITDFHGDAGTGKSILNRLADEGREDIKTFLTYRRQAKLTQAFFPSYREMQHEGVIHCSFNPTGTRTGRLSSSGPNLQQVPGHLHGLFVARPGYHLATFDMSAIEPRLICYYSGDRALWDIIATGQDFHGYNTKIFFDLDCDVAEVKARHPHERKVGKEVGLSLFYGAGGGRLQETALKYGYRWSKSECYRKVDRFKAFYPGVYQFRDEVLNPALAAGELVHNLLGRPLRIADPEHVHMTGLNTLIQSSASDLVVHSAHRMTEQFRARGLDAHPLLLVHDEVVVEVPDEHVAACRDIIIQSMTDYNLTTPHGPIRLAVEGKVATRWEK